jgi:hypothetical protein
MTARAVAPALATELRQAFAALDTAQAQLDAAEPAYVDVAIWALAAAQARVDALVRTAREGMRDA